MQILSNSQFKYTSTVNIELSQGGNFRVFRDIAFFAKISPTQK